MNIALREFNPIKIDTKTLSYPTPIRYAQIVFARRHIFLLIIKMILIRYNVMSRKNSDKIKKKERKIRFIIVFYERET